jgi:hypothetical protein
MIVIGWGGEMRINSIHRGIEGEGGVDGQGEGKGGNCKAPSVESLVDNGTWCFLYFQVSGQALLCVRGYRASIVFSLSNC